MQQNKKRKKESHLVFCKDVRELIINMGVDEYSLTDWRVFIDSSKRSLKCVLLHNGNKYWSIPIAHSIKINEEYETVAFILKKINYTEGFKYVKAKSQIVLSKKHKEVRLEIINNWITSCYPWDQTDFSDEKRFSFNGPDNWRTCHEHMVRCKRQCQGGDVMVWMMVLPNCHRRKIT